MALAEEASQEAQMKPLVILLCLALGGCELPVIWHYLTCGDEPCHPQEPK